MSDAFKELRGIILELDLADPDEVCEIQDKLNVWCCCAGDGHYWINDQCGYWQHQMCAHCNTPKYPKLVGKSCSELDPTSPELIIQ